MSEKAWTKKLCKQMAECGALIIPYVGSRMQMNGVPDRYVHYHRLQCGVWLEIKMSGNWLSDLQEAMIKALNRRIAFSTFVVQHPNTIHYISHEYRSIKYEFNGSGKDLLDKLVEIRTHNGCISMVRGQHTVGAKGLSQDKEAK